MAPHSAKSGFLHRQAVLIGFQRLIYEIYFELQNMFFKSRYQAFASPAQNVTLMQNPARHHTTNTSLYSKKKESAGTLFFLLSTRIGPHLVARVNLPCSGTAPSGADRGAAIWIPDMCRPRVRVWPAFLGRPRMAATLRSESRLYGADFRP